MTGRTRRAVLHRMGARLAVQPIALAAALELGRCLSDRPDRRSGCCTVLRCCPTAPLQGPGSHDRAAGQRYDRSVRPAYGAGRLGWMLSKWVVTAPIIGATYQTVA